MWAMGTVIHSAKARACCVLARRKALRVHASSLLAAALSVLASPTAPAASAGAIEFKRKLSPGLITVAHAFTWPVYFVATTARPHAPRHALPSLTSAAPPSANQLLTSTTSPCTAAPPFTRLHRGSQHRSCTACPPPSGRIAAALVLKTRQPQPRTNSIQNPRAH